MTTAFSPLATEIPRDRWGRPSITPVDGGKAIGYTRVSTLAKALSDTEGLTQWKQGMVARGMAMRPDLVDMAAAVGDDKAKLSEIVKSAMSAAQSDRAANAGTTLHAWTERIDLGEDIANMPKHLQADLEAYRDSMRGLQVLKTEFFTVCDEVLAAGTPDKLLRLPDGRNVIGDLKTGANEPKFPVPACIQMSIYAHGHLYDPDRGRIGYLPELGVDQATGILIHLPQGSGVCNLYTMDLVLGWSLALTAVAVRDAFKRKDVIEKYQP